MAPGWPVVLTEGDVRLRRLRRRDNQAWMILRAQNASWLEPWDATSPVPVRGPRPSFGEFVRSLNAQARSGSALPFALDHQGVLVGQLTVSGIAYGSLRSASIGYWVSRHVAGRGIMPTAVAMAADHCFGVLGLHRVEVNIRPENLPSLRVVEKLGFREEGVRKRYLHIGDEWCDHRSFALTVDELPPGGLLARWRSRR
ncbi:GNAT family N-acetyltransferase [Cellulomonas chengniuliangii]|uniref:GNAT family N-acetyltransferase n=1 Tax=Cellulomonas chengniuliangii TaxID=2968084 RepID=A0ABY5L3G4_9CELL|nr:GNAT family protein [Cellulomonas chengniuliangii]MCC2307163.1 GNAT family N-acetyltransferase [Cellulomonas chengniuliangii]MCC2317940.1 GNAT family N-acetyltransferase [Cellulomonas chengniuliangii]UUI76041.1 GNAT family N-acetyltransferase [Cellulomonas chengniuliangii]